jgi:threonine dehydratase
MKRSKLHGSQRDKDLMTNSSRLERIQLAYSQIPAVFRDTPQFVSEGLSQVVGCRVLCKVETVNPVRSFKGRGASFFLKQQAHGETIVTASAGNFGMAMAYAAREFGQRLIVFAATNANSLKVARMKALGATVRLDGDDFDAAKDRARSFAEGEKLPFVEDGLVPEITEGAGTIGIELSRGPEPIAAVVVPVGNGSLINGVGEWVHAHIPGCQVIGVCAEKAPATALSWRAGRVHTTATAETAADGIAVRVPIAAAVEEMRNAVDDFVTVSEESMAEAMQLLRCHLGLIVEPSGAAATAALAAIAPRFKDGLIAVIVTGGNVAQSSGGIHSEA